VRFVALDPVSMSIAAAYCKVTFARVVAVKDCVPPSHRIVSTLFAVKTATAFMVVRVSLWCCSINLRLGDVCRGNFYISRRIHGLGKTSSWLSKRRSSGVGKQIVSRQAVPPGGWCL
jgi:hypothetical protein